MGASEGFYAAHHDGPHRTATMLMYLSTVASGGGATVFPHVHVVPAAGSGTRMPPRAAKRDDATALKELRDACASETALKIAPVKGAALLVYNLHPDGTVDEKARHGACPVHHDSDDVKWVAQQWVKHTNKVQGAGTTRSTTTKLLEVSRCAALRAPLL